MRQYQLMLLVIPDSAQPRAVSLVTLPGIGGLRLLIRDISALVLMLVMFLAHVGQPHDLLSLSGSLEPSAKCMTVR
jgi:hypothetical protein